MAPPTKALWGTPEEKRRAWAVANACVLLQGTEHATLPNVGITAQGLQDLVECGFSLPTPIKPPPGVPTAADLKRKRMGI